LKVQHFASILDIVGKAFSTFCHGGWRKRYTLRRSLGAAPLWASRARVLTFLPDRLRILSPIRFFTDGVDLTFTPQSAQKYM
jgi:hypothetical protein